MFKNLKNLTTSSGVYYFLNLKKQVLYVGKAKNLKNRLSSYRLIKDSNSKTFKLLKKSTHFKTIITDSELEALILEAELIKTYQPPYNVSLKNDTSPLYIVFTKEDYPRVLLVRKSKFDPISQNYFGPFPSATKARQVLKILRPIFPFCNATPIQKKAKKACFYYHLHLCPGACNQTISKKDYLTNLNHLKLLLKSKKSRLIKTLKTKLIKTSKLQKFEQANVYKDQIVSLKSFNRFKLSPDKTLPSLTEDKAHEKILHLRRLLKRFISLPNNYPLKRIEAYDISNLEGKQATGSMVVFINGQPAPDQYRIFKIKSLDTPNDLAMLKEVLVRRSKHKEWGIPNLILIDGGKNQLKVSLSSCCWNIPVVSLAKNPERLLLPNLQGVSLQVASHLLSSNDPASQLLIHLRDESHRFAKNLHTRLKTKSLITPLI